MPLMPGKRTSSTIRVDVLFVQARQRFFGAARLDDGIAGALEHHPQRAADVLLVVDDQDPGGHASVYHSLPVGGGGLSGGGATGRRRLRAAVFLEQRACACRYGCDAGGALE